MIDLWLPPKPAIIRPHIEKASFLPGMFPAGAAAAIVASFPVVQATNSGNTGSNAASYAAPLPASIQAGDLLLLLVSVNNTITLTTPSGWTQLFNTANGALRHACYYKTASGSEGSTVTVTGSGSAGWATNSYRITGHQGAPEAGTSATGTSNSPNPPSLTPSWGSAKTLWLAAVGNIVGGGTTATAPTNYGNQVTAAASFSARCSSSRRELEASSEDPGTYALSASQAWVTNTVAIRPA